MVGKSRGWTVLFCILFAFLIWMRIEYPVMTSSAMETFFQLLKVIIYPAVTVIALRVLSGYYSKD